VKLLLLTALIVGFHSLSEANELIASVITKKDNQLVMISEVEQTWELNHVPFNSLKNLRIKGISVAEQNAILVFDINDVVGVADISQASDTHVMTAQGRLIAAEVVPELNAIKVEISEDGDLITVTHNLEKAVLIGKLSPMNQSAINMLLLLNAAGQIVSSSGVVMGRAVNDDGALVSLVTDLDGKIATLSGSGSEIVVIGEQKDFLSSINQLDDLNAQQKQNPSWAPVTDLKISNLSSVVQIEFRNSNEDDSFGLFKFVSPLVISRIKENQGFN
jgi:hypothetical protein